MIILTLFGMSVLPAAAQQPIQVSGTVADDSGLPLIGVSVSIPGTTTGVLTDIDGAYRITVPEAKATLRFAMVGFSEQTITVGNQTVINVVMHEDLQMLDEVVVVGYGVQKKSHLTGSITTVRTDGLEDTPTSRLDQALQGRVAGVQIQNTTSEVGQAPQIRVRGMGSISADSGPLVIVDGFPVDEGLGIVNMNDVESIEILKDAASAAIYGSRAANGVIMVTTKAGSIDKPKYSLRTSWGTKSAYELHPVMSATEYFDMRVNEERLRGATSFPASEFPFGVIRNYTDWQKEALRTANIYSVQLGISGGTKGVKYYVSASYMNDQGIMLDNEFEKMNLRSRIESKLSSRVTFGANIAPTYTKRTRPSTNFIDFYRTPSWMPVRHTAETAAITKYPEGDYAHGAHFNNQDYTGTDPLTGDKRTVRASPFNTVNHNPRSLLDNEKIYQNDYRLQGSVFLNVNISEGLDFRTSNGTDIAYRDVERYRKRNARRDNETNRGLYQNRLLLDLLSENTLTYNTKVNTKHDINGLLGFSAQRTTIKTAGLLGVDFPTDYLQTLNQAGSILIYEGDTRFTGTWKVPSSMASVFSRLIYSYDDKYLLSLSIRTDGSSKFGKDNRWGWFPSASLGWRASEEKFLKDAKWADQLKFRASYGVTGTDNIEAFANMDLLQSANYILGSGSGNVTSGIANNSSSLGNSKLSWEQTNEFNTGLDLSVLNNRVGLTLDYYYSKTKRLLFKKPISSISGYTQNWTNLGQIRNKGVELEITTYNVQNKDFKWNTAFNFSANRNKVLDLGGDREIINRGERNEMYITRVGLPAVQFWGYKTIGIWNSDEEIRNNASHINDQPGGLRVQNTNGDGVINESDMVVIGDPFPNFTWGITNNFSFKGFDLSFLIQGVEGVDVWNGDEYYNESRKWNRNYVTNRWINEENPGDGKTPYFNNGMDHMMTDIAIQDGSYISLRDITFGYTAPKKYARRLGLSSLRIYTSIQNLGYWWRSDYKGINPESRYTSSPYDTPLHSGYQRGGFPIQRTFSFGIDINF
jgi:TonB-linked SusC/RagA family outer membrane protein